MKVGTHIIYLDRFYGTIISVDIEGKIYKISLPLMNIEIGANRKQIKIDRNYYISDILYG